jgi:hypothetical protein
LTKTPQLITVACVNGPQWRGYLEQLRIAASMGATPQPRLEQIRLKLERFSLSLPGKAPDGEPITVAPVVIGAVGGSGTRALVQVLRRAGWFMGERVDSRNQDSLPVACFLTKWLRRLTNFPNIDDEVLAKARSDFERALHIHRTGISSPDACWGWKNPRSVWLIPFLADRFPQMRFIHMVRDARDMAVSQNRSFLKDHGHWLLGSDWWRDIPMAQCRVWRLSNNRALEFAQQHLGERYQIIRYEDLCQKPAETVSRLLGFLGVPEMNVEPLIKGIRNVGNIGRWRRTDLREVRRLSEEIDTDLERFGYEA